MDVNLIRYDSQAEWLAARNFGIGASESAAIFGLAPEGRESAYSLWAKKSGLIEPDELDEEWIEWGHILEEPIAKRYAKRTGNLLWTPPTPFCVVQHPRLPFLTATIDRWIIEAQGRVGRGDLEIKNVGMFNRDWKDGNAIALPLHVQVQVQHQLACTGFEYADVAALVGGNHMEIIPVERNKAFIEELEARAEEFWGRVQRKEPPQVDGSDATAKAIKKLHPDDDGSTIELPESAIKLVEDWKAANATKLAAEKEEKAAKNELQALIGKATFGRLPNGVMLTLKTTSRDGYTVEPTKYRTLRAEMPKAAKKGKAA